MKTIEERAELLSTCQEICGGNFASVYLKVAKDQQKIDTDKAKAAFESACKWLNIYFWIRPFLLAHFFIWT